ncbi:putative endo-polygalacturonase [Helianthus anomalus]
MRAHKEEMCFRVIIIIPLLPGFQALMFKRCNGLRFNGLTHVNSPRVHITITTCYNVIVSNLHIIAPETSPNTDGINVASSTNVNIHDSVIEIGDHCISLSGGSSDVKISGIMCGPDHGIRFSIIYFQKYIYLGKSSLNILHHETCYNIYQFM